MLDFVKSISVEASILLMKLYFSQANYEEAFKQISANIELQQVMKEHVKRLKQMQKRIKYLKSSSNSLRQKWILTDSCSSSPKLTQFEHLLLKENLGKVNDLLTRPSQIAKRKQLRATARIHSLPEMSAKSKIQIVVL